MPPPMQRPAVLALLALLAVLPAFLPGAEVYLDNPSHIVEVELLADEVLLQDRWFTGWSDQANVGFAVNQVNAPLLWGLLGLLVAAGLPLLPLYGAAVGLSNVVFVFGARRLMLRVGLSAHAAWIGAMFAAVSVQDLYGYSGAAGGMWPHRLANGLLLWGLGQTAPGVGFIGLGLGLLVLCHTYSGMVGFALVGLALVLAAGRRDVQGVLRYGLALGLGLLIAAPFWIPLLEPSIRPSSAVMDGVRYWSIIDSISWLLLPLNPVKLGEPWKYWFLGTWTGFPAALALLAGLWVARKRPWNVDPELSRFLLLAIGILFLLVAALVPVADITFLGPNPWRHLTLIKTALFALAGLGLARVLPALPAVGLGVVLAGLSAWTGLREMRLPLPDELRDNLHQTWAEVAAESQGRVYHQNTNLNGRGPRDFFFSEVGVLMTLDTGRPTVGSWYSINAIATRVATRSEGIRVMGKTSAFLAGNPGWLAEQCRLFGIDGFITVDPDFYDRLSEDDDFRKVAHNPPFAGFILNEADIAPIQSAALTDVVASRGRLTATATREGAFLYRQSWHPWWQATLNGQPIPLGMEPETGLIKGRIPAAGALEIQFVNPSRWTAWLMLLGLLGAAVGWRALRVAPPVAKSSS